jgi:hypothetical protein
MTMVVDAFALEDFFGSTGEVPPAGCISCFEDLSRSWLEACFVIIRIRQIDFYIYASATFMLNSNLSNKALKNDRGLLTVA